MSDAHAHDIKKEVKVYMVVFAALAAFTVITVAISYLHLQLFWAVTVALCVAFIKGSLVACYFMHLISEKKLIYTILIFVMIFFLGLLFGPVLGHHDPLVGTGHVP